MNPDFALEVYKRTEIELTRRLEYERVARERIDAMRGAPVEGWRSRVQRWWKSSFVVRRTTASPVACCATAAAC